MRDTLTEPNGTLYQVAPEDMNLSGDEVRLFNRLLATWQSHLTGNVRNEAYYRGKVRPVTTDPDMPGELRDLDVVVGWGSKAVDALASRTVFSGFEGGGAEDINDAVGELDMADLYAQAVTSELTDSCSFVTVSRGLAGEPDVIVSAHSALDAAAIWDERRKRVRAGICVVDIEEDESGTRVPTWVNMYTDSRTYSCRRRPGGAWVAESAENPLGRPLIEPLRYRPSLARPFGRSRITRTVRSLIDRAMCVAARTETSAVFYTYPQRYLLGVDRKTAESMARSKVETYVDRLLLVSTNRNGDTPQLGQLSQMSMQPHTDHLETLAKQFASEASIPLDEVGIVFDNPSSAEAMYSAQQRLIIEAEGVNRSNGIALRNVALMALACIRGTDIAGLSEEDREVRARFENPMRPSMAARADYAIKVVSAVPAYASTEHFWRDLGYDSDEIRSIMRDVRYAQAAEAIAQQAAQQAAAGASSAEGETATEGAESR